MKLGRLREFQNKGGVARKLCAWTQGRTFESRCDHSHFLQAREPVENAAREGADLVVMQESANMSESRQGENRCKKMSVHTSLAMTQVRETSRQGARGGN